MAGRDSIGGIFDATVSADAAGPLLTYYDDAAGERVECSGATLANWVAKTANMLGDGCGLGEGDRASLGLPPHWQTAAIMLACWSAGLSVAEGPAGSDVAFVHAERALPDWPATERYACSLHPLALPMREVPAGYADFNTEVRAFGDHFSMPAIPGSAPALVRAIRTRSHAEMIEEAAARATARGIVGGRVLVDADAYPDVLDWLLVPLVTGASIVLCRNVDPARESRRAATERVTARSGSWARSAPGRPPA